MSTHTAITQPSGVARRITLAVATAVGAAALSMQASAFTITFGGITPDDGSGQTSAQATAANTSNLATGVFVETFDTGTYSPLPNLGSNGFAGPGIGGGPSVLFPTGTSGTTSTSDVEAFGGVIENTQTYPLLDEDENEIPLETVPTYNADSGFDACSINAWGGPSFSSTGGTDGQGAPTQRFGVQRGTLPNNAARPADNTTCFAYGPGHGGELPASLGLDYTPIFEAFPVDTITYLGLYYGSIDDYNQINFSTVYGGTFTILGSDILDSPANSGDQFKEGSNVYVNLEFPAWWRVSGFEFVTTGVAYEFDNVVVRTEKLPAPATLALFATGLLGLGGAINRRRKLTK